MRTPAAMAPPSLDDGPALPPSAVAARLGIAPATLRTWDRRYGLGPTVRTAGAHRRYAPSDVARLQVMRRLVLDGVPAGEAARVARSAVPGAREEDGAAPERVAAGTTAASTDLAARPTPVLRGGGGAVLRVGDVAEPAARAAARGLARAAQALDAEAVVAAVRAQLRERGVEGAWDHVLRPVLRAIGDRWAATGEGVEVEHLLARCTAAALHAHALELAAHGGRVPRCPRPVLLSTVPQEQHELPLHVVACGLTERGVSARLLGGPLPAAALSAALRRTRASAVLVWAQLPELASVDVLEALPVTRPPAVVVAAGPAWPEALPDGVVRVDDLRGALDVLAGAVGAGERRPGPASR